MKQQVNLLLNCYRPQIDISWFQTMIFARPAHNVIECKRVRFMTHVHEPTWKKDLARVHVHPTHPRARISSRAIHELQPCALLVYRLS